MRFGDRRSRQHDDTAVGACARARRRLAAIAVLAGAFGVLSAAPATATVGWSVHTIAGPTQFSTSDRALCEKEIERGEVYPLCDRYELVVRNVGDTASSGPIVVTDRFPLATAGEAESAGEKPHRGRFGGEWWTCSSEVIAGSTTVTCTSEFSVAPEVYAPNPSEATPIIIPVVAPGAGAGILRSEVTVTGGGASEAGDALTIQETPFGPERSPFEVADFGFAANAVGGGASTQAGGHPGDITADLEFSTFLRPTEVGFGLERFNPTLPVQSPRSASVELPLGFIGDPLATPTCSEEQLAREEEGRACPPASRIGIATVNAGGHLYLTGGGEGQSGSAIYNIAPHGGYPAEFGFSLLHRSVLMYASVVHTDAGYRLRTSAPSIPAAVGIGGVSLTFFGDPGKLNEESAQPAFLTNPADCSAGSLSARVEADSWEDPGRLVTNEAATYPGVTGCDQLRFEPSLGFAPSSGGEGGTSQADEPSAYTVDLKIPQTSGFDELGTPPLRDATVTLPAGVSVSPSAAQGLVGCQAVGPEGINLGSSQIGPRGQDLGDPEATELGAGYVGGNGSQYEDGYYHLAPGHCPAASQIGTVEAITPILADPLLGRVFVALPKCGGEGQPACTVASATNGELYGLYLEVQGPGFVVKFPGSISADPVTGRLTASFKDLIQQPFSDFKLHLKGGPRAPLANPQACGAASTSSVLEPWSAPGTPDALVSSSFSVDWDGQGGGCPAGLPFSPGFSAGTVSSAAGAFSPFTLSLSRHDREQDLGGLTVTTPAGLLGRIAGIPLCGEPQASQGTCSSASQVGSTSVGAGAGSQPLWVSGRVYLTGPYNGAPFGLSIVVPAVAGPFNLGNVVVRAAIRVDPHSGQVTVVSDPLPQIVDGVPLRVQTVNVTLDRPGFIFNPTSCVGQQVTATVGGVQGASAGVSSPFAATGCRDLAFHPSFTVSTQAKTSKAGGASLDVRVGYPAAGQANIRSVAVTLPKQLPSRLTTIQQACPEATFNANPASCPVGSDVGIATANTPVLSGPVTGPAYLVSHGGAAFPDLVLILQGEGVTLDLVGSIDIKHGVTSSTFGSVPDAPISAFDVSFPEGPHSALTTNLPAKAKGNLCGQSLTMPTTITGQNGAVIKQNTKIAVTGCPKVKPKPKAKAHRKHKKTKKKGGKR
jgi:hypothetical protein